MLNKKNIIWSNIDLNLEDWKADLQAEAEENGEGVLSEDELYRRMEDTNDNYLLDERCNLNIQLDNPIIVIADLGLWKGRRSGYKVIESGNIKDCLYSEENVAEWYVDAYGNMRATVHHHDGTNYYLYRELKDNLSDAVVENFKFKLYNGSVTDRDISHYTRRIGDRVANVYGWEVKAAPKKGGVQ